MKHKNVVNGYKVLIVLGLMSMLGVASINSYAGESLMLVSGNYVNVKDNNNSIKTENIPNGWYTDSDGNTYYIINNCKLRGFNYINSKPVLFESLTGKLILESSKEYLSHIAEIKNAYDIKFDKNKDVGYLIKTFDNEMDAYIFIENYNFIYLFSELDLGNTGFKVVYDESKNKYNLILNSKDITFEERCNELKYGLRGLNNKNVSDEIKAMQVHDLILSKFRPDYTMTYHGGMLESKDNKLVCIGYASTFQRLCQYVGLECEVITGESYGDSHAWNKVKIKSSWKYVDCTFDATDKDMKGTDTSYEWFLKSKQYFDVTHTPYQ